MEKEKSKFIVWVKTHKKELTVAGISATSLIAIILGMNNKEFLMTKWDNLKSIVKSNAISNNAFLSNNQDVVAPKLTTSSNADSIAKRIYKTPFNVNLHIRNLAKGQHASPKKTQEASELGIILKAGQTIVDSYEKGKNAA